MLSEGKAQTLKALIHYQAQSDDPSPELKYDTRFHRSDPLISRGD